MENQDLPEETVLYYSQKKVFRSWILVGLAVLLYAAYWLFYRDSYFISGMFGICAFYIIYVGIQKIRNKKPQLILSNKGITSNIETFKSWAEIFDEEVYFIPNKNYNAGLNFRYYFDDGEENIFLEALNVNENNFRNWIRIYRENSVKLHPEIYTEYRQKEKSTKKIKSVDGNLSAAQKYYLAKNNKSPFFQGNSGLKKIARNHVMSISQTCHPFLIFFCLLVSPAIFDQFSPLKTKTEIIRDVYYGDENFRTRYSSSSLTALKITTDANDYKIYGSNRKLFNSLSNGDSLTITKTQLLSIPKKFKSKSLTFEYHEDDYFVFYTSILVVLMFLLSLIFKGDKISILIFAISIVSTVICVGMYL